jgi:hypothetical protein
MTKGGGGRADPLLFASHKKHPAQNVCCLCLKTLCLCPVFFSAFSSVGLLFSTAAHKGRHQSGRPIRDYGPLRAFQPDTALRSGTPDAARDTVKGDVN